MPNEGTAPAPDNKMDEAKKAKLEEALKNVADLRERYQKAAEDDKKKMKEDFLKTYGNLREDLKSFDCKLPAIEDAAKELESVLSAVEKDLTERKRILDSIDRRERSAKILIKDSELLKGRKMDAGGVKIASGGKLIEEPESDEDLLHNPQGEYTSKTLQFSDTSAASSTEANVNNMGYSWIAAGEVSGGGITGSGVVAASISSKYQYAREEHSARSGASGQSKATRIESRYEFVPKKDVAFETLKLKLSQEANERLQGIRKEGSEDKIAEFYRDFGTHFAVRTTLGGYYRHHAKAESTKVKEQSQVETTVSEAMNWAVRVSASYYGAVTASGALSVDRDSHTDAGNIKKLSYERNEVKVNIETSGKGGKEGLPVDLWLETLEDQSRWKAIDSELYPVWELIRNKHGDDLAKLFEKVWVQKTFADSLADVMPDEVIQHISSKLTRAKDLEKYLRELAAPSLEMGFFSHNGDTVNKGSTNHGVVECKVPEGFKLIGGGAHVIAKGIEGNLLTASYPKEDGRTWEARCKDHHSKLCPATLWVWAIGLRDPKDEWDVKIFPKPSDKGPHPSVTAWLEEGYALTGGGAKADWTTYGSLLTASHPMGSTGWAAMSKDLGMAEEVILTAYAIGIKHKNKPLPPLTKVFQHTSAKPEHRVEASVGVPQGYTLIGGGARTKWATDGHYLVGCYPEVEKGTWNVESREHSDSESCDIVAYAIGLAT